VLTLRMHVIVQCDPDDHTSHLIIIIQLHDLRTPISQPP
jgi:hypothetical protein